MAPRRTPLSDSSSTSIVQTQHQQQHYPHHQYQPHQQQQQEHQQLHQQQQFFQQHQNLLNTQNLLLTTAPNFTFNTNNINNNDNMPPMQQTTTTAITTATAAATANSLANSNTNNANTNNQNGHHHSNNNEKFTRCSLPNSNGCLKLDALIHLDELSDCQRVICNNENCNVGQYMHRECFDQWEQSVLNALKSNGRARSWSERQRAQNLWTKKGYDLVYKICGCKCGRGHIRKDLDWTAPPPAAAAASAKKLNGLCNGLNNNNNNNNNNANNNANVDDDDKKKKKKRNRNQNQTQNQSQQQQNQAQITPQKQATTTPTTNGNNQQQKAQHQQQQKQQHSQQQINGNGGNATTITTITTNNGGDINSSIMTPNNLSPNPNVGVIGSGLHQNNQQHQQQQLQQQQNIQQQHQSVVASLSNMIGLSNGIVGNGNILGLDLRNRASSLSSSGSTSPSASHSSGDISISPIHNHHHHHHHQHYNSNQQNGAHFNQQQQQQQLQLHMQQLQQQQQQQSFNHQQLQHLQFLSNPSAVTTAASLLQNGLTKSILNGLNGCVAQNAATAQQHQQQQQQQNLMNSITATINANAISNGLKSPPPPAPLPQQQQPQPPTSSSALSIYDQQQLIQQQKYKEVEIYSERVRSTSGCNGIFSRRLDFSSFNLLPKTRLNSYQVKIEDEGNHGNDETRLFILSSLAQSHMSRVACILCEDPMLVFDRYPLVDGSFFLSPKQHSPGCIEVKYEGRTLYLTCVCMGCLDGISSNRAISCRFCGEFWDGSNLVLGTMYAYDIFAAMPCCAERLKCNNCFKLLLYHQQRLNFFSDYSHCVTCPYCTTQDTHFVKPLNYCYTKGSTVRQQQLA